MATQFLAGLAAAPGKNTPAEAGIQFNDRKALRAIIHPIFNNKQRLS